MSATAESPRPPHSSARAGTRPPGTGDMARSLEDLPEELAVHLPRLLEAMVSVGSGLELHHTLDRIVETAAGLTGARYAVIGVINDRCDGLADLVSHGLSEAERQRIAALPDGEKGILGVLVTDPAPLMLADLGADARRSTEFPPRSALLGDFLGVPIRVGEELFGSLYLAEKQDGGEFSVLDLHMMNVLATEAGIQIGNARLYEEARQRGRWIDGAAALTTTLLAGAGGDTRADDALAVVAEQGRRLAEAAAGIVLLPAERGGLEIVQVSSARPEALQALGQTVAPSIPVYGQLMEGEPVFTDDASTDPRMPPPLAEPYGPSMMLPLRSEGRVRGTLVLSRLRGARGYGEAERTLAVQFAAQAALALVLAEAQRDRERLAVYEDRDRIARDLHDLVVQRLFATGMMLEGTQRKAHDPEVREGISRAVDEMDLTIQEIRSAIFALQQGPAEAPSGLRTRVEREVNTASALLGFRPSARFVGAVDHLVGEPAGRHLVAALREALSNVFRHAAATRVDVVVDATVRLPDGTSAVRLTVSDDGVGLPSGGRRSGLRNLAVRAEGLGGSSTLGPGLGEHGEGTSVIWEVPLRAGPPEE